MIFASCRSLGASLILCPFNAFMHLYTRADIESALSEVRRLLSPDGMFALDVFHPDPVWLARNPTRRFARTRLRHPRTGERLIYTTSHVYDPRRSLRGFAFSTNPMRGQAQSKRLTSRPQCASFSLRSVCFSRLS